MADSKPGTPNTMPASAADVKGAAPPPIAPTNPPANAPDMPAKPPTAGDIGGANIQAVTQTGQAPAVHTGPITKKIKDLEESLKQLDDARSVANARARATTRAQLAELKDIEARQKGGLNELTPVGNLLSVDAAIHEQYPDDHLRWVNETMPGRAALLTAKGYTRVPGQIAGGDNVLWKIPRNKWAEGVSTKQAMTDAQLRKAGNQNRDDVVQELQTFFDKHGVKIDANDLVLKERA